MFVKKKYGTIVIGSSFLAFIFSLGAIVTLILTLNLWFAEEDMLSKLGTASSITGLLVGTFIAIWLINRDRNKKLEENNNYKEWLLVNLQGVIFAVQQSIFNYATGSTGDELSRIIKSCEDDFNYWKGLIEKINFNPQVPIKIRSSVAMFFHQGIKPLYSPSFVFLKDDDSYLKNTFLNLLDRIVHTPYIQNDKDEEIQRLLKMVDESIQLVKDAAALTPKRDEINF